MTIEVYAFRYRSSLTGRWVKARYKATREEIARRHDEWELVGEAEVRTPVDTYFTPYRVVTHAELKRLSEPPPVLDPHLRSPPEIDRLECFLTGLFLRRYVRYCMRCRRFAQMQGAARLHREVSALRREG
jgi:hypothetical protein